MNENDLELINSCLKLFDEYDYLNDLFNIKNKINKLVKVLNSGDIHRCEIVCNEIVNSTDFENIKIKNVNKQNMTRVQIIKTNCYYIIERLSVLALKKISEHELEKDIETNDTNLSILLESVKIALKNEKNKRS